MRLIKNIKKLLIPKKKNTGIKLKGTQVDEIVPQNDNVSKTS